MPFVVVRDDITKMKVDAIVNPTNRYFKGTKSIDGIIHKLGGEALENECLALNGCEVGEAKITNAYGLPCKYIIHTVGPTWIDGNHQEKNKLFSCYASAVKCAKTKEDISSIAFPLISSGNFAFPKDIALDVACMALEKLANDKITIYLVIYDTLSLTVGKFKLQNNIQYSISEKEQIDVTSVHKSDFATWENEYLETFTDCKIKIEELYEKIFSMSLELFMRNSIYSDWGTNTDSKRFLEDLYALEDMCHNSLKDKIERFKDRISEIERINTVQKLIYANNTEINFSDLLFDFIRVKGLKTSDVYKKANITRAGFSKVRGDYHPKKNIAISYALALELDLEETQRLLSTAGYVLSYSIKEDLIIMECIHKGIFNIAEVNVILLKYCGHGL